MWTRAALSIVSGARQPSKTPLLRVSLRPTTSPAVLGPYQCGRTFIIGPNPRVRVPDDEKYLSFDEKQADLNWSLCDDGIAPEGDAYRNAPLKKLVSFAVGTLDKAKALNVNRKAFAQPTVYSTVDGALPGAKLLTANQFEKIMKKTQDYFDHASNIFVSDGALGSYGPQEIGMRAIADTSCVGLYYNNVLVKLPMRDPLQFRRPIIVYSGLKFKIFQPEAVGLQPTPFIALDPSSGHIIAAGPLPTPLVRSVVTSLAGMKLPNPTETFMLKAHTFVTPSNTTALLFGASLSALPPSVFKHLYAAHNTFWSAAGISRVFAGFTVESATFPSVKGGLVEHFEGPSLKTTYVTSEVPCKIANVIDAPASIVFFVTDTTGTVPPIAKITSAQASQLAGQVVALPSQAEAFAAKIKSASIPAYIVNSHGQTKLALETNVAIASLAKDAAPIANWGAVSPLAAKSLAASI
mmetsp:Transcript_9979/g.17376  ORF Transcript_9979/g.17376 Transcript_9979/m.17376 type:complete len:465 (-) Transcript_9979:269-1663(-)